MKKVLMIVLLIFMAGCTVKPPLNLDTTTPTFKWTYPTEGSYAERFKVEIFKNGELDWSYTVPDNGTTIQFNNIEIEDIYKIRVYGIDEQNNLGKPSDFSREFKFLLLEGK